MAVRYPPRLGVRPLGKTRLAGLRLDRLGVSGAVVVKPEGLALVPRRRARFVHESLAVTRHMPPLRAGLLLPAMGGKTEYLWGDRSWAWDHEIGGNQEIQELIGGTRRSLTKIDLG